MKQKITHYATGKVLACGTRSGYWSEKTNEVTCLKCMRTRTYRSDIAKGQGRAPTQDEFSHSRHGAPTTKKSLEQLIAEAHERIRKIQKR